MNPPLMYSTYPSESRSTNPSESRSTNPSESRYNDIQTPISPKEVDEVHSVFYVVLVCYFTAMFFVLRSVIHDTEPHLRNLPPYNISSLCEC